MHQFSQDSIITNDQNNINAISVIICWKRKTRKVKKNRIIKGNNRIVNDNIIIAFKWILKKYIRNQLKTYFHDS